MFNVFKRSDYRHRYSNRPQPQVPNYRNVPSLGPNLEATLKYLRKTAGESNDFAIRSTFVNGHHAAIAFYSTTVNQQTIEDMLRAIQQHTNYPKGISNKNFPYYLAEHVLPNQNVLFVHNLWEIREGLSRGQAALFIDGLSIALCMGATSVEHRSPDTPLLESSTRGPQVGFVENIEVNVGLMRRSLSSDALTVKQLTVGYRSRTQVAVLYQHDVANPILVDTVIKRIRAVHVDKLTGSATLEQRIVDNHWTPYPLSRATTRLDNCIKEVGQGKVMIIADGDPTAFLVPANITDFFQTMEDDQHNYVDATFIRWLRLISFVLSLYLPAMYIAFSDFNPELMPRVLALQIARSREGVPFTAAFEVLIMQVVIEIIREAALRMPKVMGQTIGIVGGLVLGEAAVQAGLVSNILIVIIALTAVSVFVTPSYEFTTVIRIQAWLLVGGATFFGIYGILLVTMALLYHVASLKSFGTVYLTPIDGEHWSDFFMDGLFRLPIPLLDRRAAKHYTQESWRGSDYTDPAGHPVLEDPRDPMGGQG